MRSIFYRPQKLLASIAFLLFTLLTLTGCDSSDAQKESGSSMSNRSSGLTTYDANENALESISLPSVVTLWKSQDHKLEPVFTPEDAIDKTIAWDNNDSSIVSIEEDGTITAKELGEATITAISQADNSIQASVKIVVDREVAQVVSGGNHTVIADSKGNVWSAGANEKGQLGRGHNENNSSFAKVKKIASVQSVVAAPYHTVALDDSGNIWVTGRNLTGSLGIDDVDLEDQNEFVKVADRGPFISVAAGDSHTLALDVDGYVWATGSDYYGQLGLGSGYYVGTFTKVPALSNIASIAAAYDSSIAINKNYGYARAFGKNDAGQLGIGSYNNANVVTQIPNVGSAISAAVGYDAAYILDSYGNVKASGYNGLGELGTGSYNDQETAFDFAISDIYYDGQISRIPISLTGITSVSAGFRRVLAVDNQGDLWTTGGNSLFFPIDTSLDWAYKDMCEYYYSYPNPFCDSKHSFSKVLGISDVKSVAVGDTYAIALDNKGALWATGVNTYGQLGFGDTDPRFGFERVPLPTLEYECPVGEYFNEESMECKLKVTSIYYVNGILNTRADAEHGKRLLQDAYIFAAEKLHENEVFLFEVAYNYSEGVVIDLCEVIAQKTQELKEDGTIDELESTAFELLLAALIDSRIKIKAVQHLSGDIAQLLEKLVQDAIVMALADSEASNLNEMLDMFNGDISEGWRVILIAHSQGNLFATEAMETFEGKKTAKSIGMVGVASAAGHLVGNSTYWTTYADNVILGLRLFSNNILPSNVDNAEGLLDYLIELVTVNHSFEFGYFLPELKSREMIDRDFQSLTYSLEFPKEKQ
jgi:alpha-tubulin suppressor-like RCC1 family protein